MRKIKVLLIGTGDLRNYGCEAIVHGTYLMLKANWPDCELYVGSDDTEYDKKMLRGYKDIHFVSYKQRFTLKRIVFGILRRIGLGDGSPVRINIGIVDSYDIFLSAGGDNFAEAPDGTIYYLLKDLMRIGNRARRKGHFYALWGVSVGPFTEKNERIVFNNLEKANVIFPREKKSFNYLREKGIPDEANIIVADPAFYMQPDNDIPSLKREKNQLLIALNISLLSIRHLYDDEKKGAGELFGALDFVLKNNPEYKYVCVPHVGTSSGGAQDDEAFMKNYYSHSLYKERIEIIPFGYGARKTKALIQQCDLLLGARMHCCVSGVSAGTPTIFLIYSRKGMGMTEYVYSDSKMSLHIDTINGDVLQSKIREVVNALDEKRKYLKDQAERFRADSEKAIKKLKYMYYK